MALQDIKCSDPLHAGRSAESDWRDVVARAEKDTGGMICSACARLRQTESTEDQNDDANTIVLRNDGRWAWTFVRKYPSGEIVWTVTENGRVNDFLNAAERTQLKALIKKMVGR